MRIAAMFLAAACLLATARAQMSQPALGTRHGLSAGDAEDREPNAFAARQGPASRPAPAKGQKTLAMLMDENQALRRELDAAGPRGLQRIKELERANEELAKELNIRGQRISRLAGDVQRLKQQINYLQQRLARPQKK